MASLFNLAGPDLIIILLITLLLFGAKNLPHDGESWKRDIRDLFRVKDGPLQWDVVFALILTLFLLVFAAWAKAGR